MQNFSSEVYLSNPKPVSECLDHLVPLTLQDKYDLRGICFYFLMVVEFRKEVENSHAK